jgi:hypothetical protein
VRNKLQEHATAAARSLSEEIEARLLTSFDDQDFLRVLAYGDRSQTPLMMRLILSAVTAAEIGSPSEDNKRPERKRWSDDPETARELFFIVCHLLFTLLVEGTSPVREKDHAAFIMREAGKRSSMAEYKAWYLLLSAGLIARPGSTSLHSKASKAVENLNNENQNPASPR